MIFGLQKSPKDEEPTQAKLNNDERPANAFEASWPFNADSPQVDGVARDDKLLSTMLVDVTGLGWDEIARYLDAVRDSAKAKNMVPIFIVDLVEYRGLIAEGLAYDTLPNVAANAPFARDLDWPSYLAYRRRLLREKWRPSAIINLGPNAGWDVL
ncbi:hypothetical protein ACERZ8_09915 [Tateyamaria armeniaca]|uniref:Uncharacterized protein n=1 Tax=Tateyamaria armeniaca TaxID=2518930 RepID=A0ABW8UW47_9RHOB